MQRDRDKADITISAEEPDFELATLVTAAGFERPLTPELALDAANHLTEDGLKYSVTYRGELGGYALFRTFGPVLYLSGIVLKPELQGQGLARQIIRSAQADTGAGILSLRTQSIRMWCAGSRAVQDGIMWPSPYGRDLLCQVASPDRDLAQRARELAAVLNCTFPFSPGFYGQALYGIKPMHRDQFYQKWWDSVCNFARGDAVLCIGRLP